MHGKTFTVKKNTPTKKKSSWFNSDCKLAKDNFYRCKRLLSSVQDDNNRILFLQDRNEYCHAKRKAKNAYYIKERNSLRDLSKLNSRKFWKFIKKYKQKKTNVNDVNIDTFVNHFKNMSDTPNENSFREHNNRY